MAAGLGAAVRRRVAGLVAAANLELAAGGLAGVAAVWAVALAIVAGLSIGDGVATTRSHAVVGFEYWGD